MLTTKPSTQDLKEIFDPLIAKRYTPDDLAALKARAIRYDPADITRRWDALFVEARALMAKGDPTSPAAIGLARRWAAMVVLFTQGDPAMAQRAAQVWKDAMADPAAAPKLPVDPAMFEFVGKATAALKAQGG